jgi:hypothetical protein
MSLNSVSTFASSALIHRTTAKKVFGGFPPCHKSSSSTIAVAPVQPSAAADAARRSSLYWNTPLVKPGMVRPM